MVQYNQVPNLTAAQSARCQLGRRAYSSSLFLLAHHKVTTKKQQQDSLLLSGRCVTLCWNIDPHPTWC